MGIDPTTLAMMAALAGGSAGYLQNNASNRFTAPQQAVQGQLGAAITGDLANPMSNPALTSVLQPVNDSYNNLADSLSQSFQARGLGRSGGLGQNLQKLQFAKAGAQGGAASSLYDQMLALASGFSTASPSQTPLSRTGGALSGGIAALLAALKAGNSSSGSGGSGNGGGGSRSGTFGGGSTGGGIFSVLASALGLDQPSSSVTSASPTPAAPTSSTLTPDVSSTISFGGSDTNTGGADGADEDEEGAGG